MLDFEKQKEKHKTLINDNTTHISHFNEKGVSIVAPVTIENTTTETTIWTGIISANELKKNSVYRISLYGVFSTAHSIDNITIKIKYGDATLLTDIVSSGVAAVATPVKPWHSKYLLTIMTVGANGTCAAYGTQKFNHMGINHNESSQSIDTTEENLTVTVEWSAAHAENVIRIDQGIIEALC